MTRQVISTWDSASGGSQDNYPQILPKINSNFAEIYAGKHKTEFVTLLDDFTGAAVDAQWVLREGTDSATIDAAIVAAGRGGVLRVTTGDAGTGLAADMGQIVQRLQWRASNGGLTIEARLSLSAITDCYVFFGFTDLAATLEAPINSAGSADTITTTATDAVGIMFDTRMATDNWWLVGVKTDVDAILQNAGFAPAPNVFEIWRIELSSAGVATFFQNDKQIGTAMANAVATAIDLTPTLNASKTAVAASMTVDVDFLGISMKR